MNKLQQAIAETRDGMVVHLYRKGNRVANIWPNWRARRATKKAIVEQFDMESRYNKQEKKWVYIIEMRGEWSDFAVCVDSWTVE